MSGTPRLLKLAAQRFDYPTVEVGKTSDGMVTVYMDTSLPATAKTLASTLLGLAPSLVSECVAWYGIPMQPVNLIIAPLSGTNDGTGGAYHADCSFTNGGDLYIDYAAQAGGIAMDTGLFIAELVECFQGASGRGFNCGGSGGEALSRLQAELVSGGPSGSLGAFASAPSWDQAGRPNWIETDQGTDTDYPSIGCGMVYFSWMMSQGHSCAVLTQAGEPAGTLASNYQALTGKTTAWADFMAGVNALGKPITNDDPFGGIAANPTPVPQPQPPPSPPTPPSPPSPPPPQPPTPPTPPQPPQPPVPPSPPSPPSPPAPAGMTKTQAITALTALVNASTLPD